MQDVLYIDRLDQASALLKPLRVEIVKRLAEPGTCPELGAALGESPQKIYYHVKALERAGVVEKVGERRVRGAVEGRYRARARAYWLSPELAGRVGRQARDQMSLGYLFTLAEEVQAEVGRLAESAERAVPSLGLSAQIVLRDGAQRAAFLRDVQQAFQLLAQRYGNQGAQDSGQGFRLALACYPKPQTLPSPSRKDPDEQND